MVNFLIIWRNSSSKSLLRFSGVWNKYKKIFRNLVTIRNEIITQGFERKRVTEETQVDHVYTKEDYASLCELVKKVNETKFIKPHYLFNLPVRNKEEDIYKDCELSD